LVRIDGLVGDNEQQYIFGTDFSDGQINGGTFADHLYGGGGLDALNGLAGDDRLEGGLGTDQLSGGADADTLVGGQGNDLLYGGDVGGADDGVTDILEGGEGEDSYFVGDGDVIDDSDRTARVIELNGQRVNGDYFGTEDNAYKSDATGLTITVSGTQALVEEKSGNDVLQSFTIKNFKDAVGTFNNGDYGIRLLEDPSGSFIEGSNQRDRLELHDAATRLEVLEGEANGQTGTVTLTTPALGVLGNGGDDDIFIVDGAPGLLISGDGFDEAPTDGNDFISAVDRDALDAGNIPQDGAFGVTILGQGGDDILDGSLRADTIRGGTGHDLVTGVHGADQLSGGDGNDLIQGNEDNDDLQGGAGHDRLLGGAGFDVLYGGGGDDRIYGDSDFGAFEWDGANQQLGVPNIRWFDPAQDGQAVHTFSIFQDVEVAEGDSDFLYGGSGKDQLFGGAADDFLYGEANDDTLQGEAGDDRVVGGSGLDILWGDKDPSSFDNDVAVLDQFTRVFPTHTAEFTLRGHADAKDVAGDDVLDGGSDNDRLHGGAGNDSYVFGFGYGSDLVIDQSGDADRVELTFGVTPDDVTLDALGSDVVLSLVDENGAATDQLTVSNWNGGGKIESIEFASGIVWDAETIATIVGPFDDDGLGENISVFFSGGAGDDSVQGLDANEAIYGNQGNDQLQAGGGNDRVFGGIGDDALFALAHTDQSYGHSIIERPEKLLRGLM
jgi:Ca2+-binding RTX toxin-like protein